MKIDTHHIPSSGLDLVFDTPAEHFPALGDLISKGECDFDGPTAFRLKAMEEKDFISVRGTVSATLRIACSRCLEIYDHPLKSDFSLTCSNKIPQDIHREDKGEIELTAEQIGVLFFEGDEIDLKDALQEQVVLAIPYRPLCSAQCKGLCSGCGQNLNQSACQCDAKPQDGPFAVLKNLKLSE